MTSFLPDDSADAERLRELLPKSKPLDAEDRAKMRRHGVASSVLYRLRDGSVPSRENIERIADGLRRPDLVSRPAIPAYEFLGAVSMAANILHTRGQHEDAQAAHAWYHGVADEVMGRTPPGVHYEPFDLPDGIFELTLSIHRGQIATAKEEAARARQATTPAAIRKRRSRARAARAARGPTPAQATICCSEPIDCFSRIRIL